MADTGEKIYVNNIPDWNEQDENAVLKIVNGVPSWVKLTSAEGVEF
jgi:hypothetical protein